MRTAGSDAFAFLIIRQGRGDRAQDVTIGL